MSNWAIVGHTVMKNKLHLNTKGLESTGTPNCGQGRIVEIVFDATHVVSMRAAGQEATQKAINSGAELCARCFKQVAA